MATVTQISNSPNLFSETGQRVVRNNDVGNLDDIRLTDQEEAEQLQQQFLDILLTQLQNQNPLDPVDTTEYTNQLVQYSALEQQIDTNVRLGSILDSLQVSSSFSAFSYIGNSVEIATNQTVVQNGEARWNYALEGNAGGVQVRVLNQNGTVVYEENLGGQSSGSYGFSLSADEAGIPLSDGDVLRIEVNANTNDGISVPTDVVTNVTVDSVETGSAGEIVLRSGGLFFGVDDILKISQNQSNQPSNENDNSGDGEST